MREYYFDLYPIYPFNFVLLHILYVLISYPYVYSYDSYVYSDYLYVPGLIQG